jgi:hypothetical protein
MRAESEFRELVRLEELLGPEDPNTLWCRESLADTLMSQAKYAEASEFREVMNRRENSPGPSIRLSRRAHVARTVLRRKLRGSEDRIHGGPSRRNCSDLST